MTSRRRGFWVFGMAALLMSSSFGGSIADANDALAWHQWRGSSRDGSIGGPAWPTDFSGLDKVWHVELGKGYSGPIAAGDRVFVVETLPGGRAGVRALSSDDGRVIWSQSWKAKGEVPFFAKSQGTWERSTPAYSDGVLYVGDMREVFRALDAETGEVRWTIDFPRHFDVSTPPFGFASSPLVVGDYVYVQAANGLVKVEKSTGEIVWRTAVARDSIMSGGAFSSPILATLAGHEQLIAFTRAVLSGVDPRSGEVLWTHDVPNFRGMNIVTPIVFGDGVFVSQHRNGSYFIRVHGDGTVRLDEDGDRGLSFETETAWTNKGSGYMSSPVIVGNQLYQHLGNGRLSNIDLSSGRENWRTKPLGEYWSMVRQGERILALDSEGVLRLVQASPVSFDVVAEREVAQQSTWGHVAVSGDMIYVRGLEGITALRWSPTAR